ncbi:unnamed protein product [Fraxinus pennsylvanica]|uniref:Uncharacterized protein n=1 Tax=Fraxinus pennsylvanica TaxID=56036 RepID=A0AAD2E073_9LAMI|nr:unnamed protein product [Fraxinus pennsylvanica]
MLRKTATIMVKNNGSNMGSFSSVEEEEAYDVVDDLSSWEFVDTSLSEDGEQEDFCSSIDDEMTSKIGKEEEEEQEEGSESPGVVISLESLSVSPPQLTLTTADVCYDGHNQEEDVDEDEDMDDEDGFGLDDELVPWMLKDRFGRQRIRKMGKRGGSRVNKSKRGPYFYNRPGAVYGKHGLGVQHSFIQ